jgi:hypothetical protein
MSKRIKAKPGAMKSIETESVAGPATSVVMEDVAKAAEALTAEGPKEKSLKEPEGAGAPGWANIPSDFNPPKGGQVIFLKFKAEWTCQPSKGDRQVICWPLTVRDEYNALQRAKGELLKTVDEMSKQMVRFIDGKPVDWTGSDQDASIDNFWREVGPRCRNLLHRVYTQTHTLNDEEHADFFENCVSVRTVG